MALLLIFTATCAGKLLHLQMSGIVSKAWDAKDSIRHRRIAAESAKCTFSPLSPNPLTMPMFCTARLKRLTKLRKPPAYDAQMSMYQPESRRSLTCRM